jgi:transcriptional regulator with PAS, ATPase and Fis domain
MVEQKKFREDLFYRLNVIAIHIPPLRERKEDIFHLCLFFLNKLNQKYGLNKTLASATADRLVNYYWPGNIRELENIIERILLTSEQDNITPEYLPENIRTPAKTIINNGESRLPDTLDNVEQSIIAKAYEKYGTTVGVAKALGISQASAARKIQKYVR